MFYILKESGFNSVYMRIFIMKQLHSQAATFVAPFQLLVINKWWKIPYM